MDKYLPELGKLASWKSVQEADVTTRLYLVSERDK